MIFVPDGLNSESVYFAQNALPLEERAQRVSFYAKQIQKIPDDALLKINYFSGAVGCPNLCQMCATGSAPNITRITREGIEDLLEAMGEIATQRKLSASSGREWRPGHILLYFDDDPALNTLTGKIVKNIRERLGAKVTTSTHGWSRKNAELQAMHDYIVATFADGFGEFRISYSNYPIGFANHEEYRHDLANMLRTYRPLAERIGIGNKGMRVDMHTRPLVQISDNFSVETIDGHAVIHSGSYLVITDNVNAELSNASIIDFGGFGNRVPIFDKPAVPCAVYVSDTHINNPDWRETARGLISSQDSVAWQSFAPHYNNRVLARNANLYQFSNADGIFFSLDPTLESHQSGFNALHLYPKTESRINSGVLDTSRFILNAILQYKKKKGIGRRESFPNATHEDMGGVVEIVERERDMYLQYSTNTARFIEKEILPLLECLIGALTEADYEPSHLFSREFFSDTGVIGNSGRGISEFKGLISKRDSSIDINDEKVRLLYLERGPLWRWAPVPYMGNLGGVEKGTIGLKNQLGNVSGIVEVCPVTRMDYEPIHAKSFYIYGVPMEQISFRSMHGFGPGAH